MNDGEKIVNAESVVNIDSTIEGISKDIEMGETLVLDIGNNYFHQTDQIYDTLVTKGYNAKKSFRDGRNQVIVNKEQK